MVMRTMRDNTKWIMLILTVAFVGWLVFDWVQGGGGAQGAASNPVVAQVNGEQIRYSEWTRFREQRLQQSRQQVEGSLSDQQLHQAEEQAWDELITQTLIRQELERLELQASPEEIRAAFRSSPPPSLRNNPAFQTDGQFDYEKYRQFFSNPGVDEQLLLQIEQYYREQIPRSKLFQRVADEVVLSRDDLWQHYRDRNATARVRFVSVSASSAIRDTAVAVTDGEIRRHYEENQEDFSRPRTAVVDIVSLNVEPSAADSAEARSTADSLRSLVAAGEKEFPALVEEISEEGSADLRAAELGPLTRDDLIGPLRDTVFALPVGRLSEPVLSPSGYHLIRVQGREGDEVSFSQVLVPIRLSPDSEDVLFDRMDELEGVALRADLETAADSLDLPIRNDLRLEEGAGFVPGAGNLGVAVSWALSAETRVGDLSQFFENASGHHLVELEDRLEPGVRPLAEVRDEIRRELMQEKKAAALRDRMEQAAAAVRQGTPLADVAAERGWEVREAGPFTRVEFVPGLGQRTAAVGTAFGLEPGGVAGPVSAGGDRLAIVELLEKSPVSREAFGQELARLRQQLHRERQQQYLQRWIQALREDAEIRDMRDQLQRGSDARAAGGPMGG
jgi:parvulin-like peptidyl-prolyl isomerase